MTYFVPWFVTFAVCWLLGTVFYSYATWLPVKAFDVFLMAGMTWAAIVVVRGYFKIYSIFDQRTEKREKNGKNA